MGEKMKKLKILSRRTSVILLYKKNRYEIIEFSNKYIYVSRWNYGVVWTEVTSTKIGKKLIKLYKKNKWEKYSR